MILTEVIKKDWRVKVLIVLFVLLTVWWRLSPELTKPYDEGFQFQFATLYFTVALWGVYCGFRTFKSLRTNIFLGRSIFFFSLGLICQIFGQIVYSYYTAVHQIKVPYPSIGDIGYFFSIPMYLFGIFYFSKLTSTGEWLHSFENKFQAVVISLVTLALAYGLFIHGYIPDFANPLKVLLDFLYPLGQACYLCIAILAYLSVQADHKHPLRLVSFLAVVSLFMQFLSDYMFVFQFSRGTTITGGINDFMYFISYFAMSFTLILFDWVSKK